MPEAKMVALVSGSSRGIGAAAARELAARGYHVIVNYLSNSAAAKEVVKAIETDGGSAQDIQADVCDEEQVIRLVEQVKAEHGRIDVLVCNANTVHPPFEQLDTLTWDTFAAKVTGELTAAFFLTQQALKIMRTRRAGRIVYVSSIDADSAAGSVAQSTAKAALNTFSRHVAGHAGLFGITVNTVAPGSVRTEASARVNTPELQQYLAERSLFGRQMEPSDLGHAIAQIADLKFAAATGQVITIDAGMDVVGQQISPVGQRSPEED
ncbi:SDR family oxidoreductase [Amycolatopsis sp. NPDC059657]|uniref:SDR family oxidoreductase n=1 Tax=Amycolatopsis sp. NPDC059657 TaxID=3346899 RepID=UPI00366DBAF6